MALNTSKCNRMMTVGSKGLTRDRGRYRELVCPTFSNEDETRRELNITSVTIVDRY